MSIDQIPTVDPRMELVTQKLIRPYLMQHTKSSAPKLLLVQKNWQDLTQSKLSVLLPKDFLEYLGAEAPTLTMEERTSINALNLCDVAETFWALAHSLKVVRYVLRYPQGYMLARDLDGKGIDLPTSVESTEKEAVGMESELKRLLANYAPGNTILLAKRELSKAAEGNLGQESQIPASALFLMVPLISVAGKSVVYRLFWKHAYESNWLRIKDEHATSRPDDARGRLVAAILNACGKLSLTEIHFNIAVNPAFVEYLENSLDLLDDMLPDVIRKVVIPEVVAGKSYAFQNQVRMAFWKIASRNLWLERRPYRQPEHLRGSLLAKDIEGRHDMNMLDIVSKNRLELDSDEAPLPLLLAALTRGYHSTWQVICYYDLKLPPQLQDYIDGLALNTNSRAQLLHKAWQMLRLNTEKCIHFDWTGTNKEA